jgi:hypothetical protein
MTRRKLPRRASLGYLMHLHIVQFTNGPTTTLNDSRVSLGKPPLKGGAQKPEGHALKPAVTSLPQ